MFFDVLAKFVTTVGNLAAGNAQAKASAFNARLYQSNATATRGTGRIEEERVRRAGRRRAGQIRANVGASGFELEGSAVDVLSESVYNSEFDALATRYTFEARAAGLEAQSGLLASQAKGAQRAGFAQAASSLLLSKSFVDTGSSEPFKLGGAT